MTDPRTSLSRKHSMSLRDRSQQKKPKRLLDGALSLQEDDQIAPLPEPETPVLFETSPWTKPHMTQTPQTKKSLPSDYQSPDQLCLSSVTKASTPPRRRSHLSKPIFPENLQLPQQPLETPFSETYSESAYSF